MKLIKKLVTLAASATLAATSIIGINTSAYDRNVYITESHRYDFLQYEHTYQADLSTLMAQIYTGTINSTNSNYDGSYKRVEYWSYTESDGVYNLEGVDVGVGTRESVTCSNTSVGYGTSKRRYVAQLHNNSSSTSEVENSYEIIYKK